MARVLVVDDDPDLLTLVELQLRHKGHQVATATTGTDAIDIVTKRGAPDVAVLDVTMQEMDGFELLDAFRANESLPEFPVIFLSGRVDPTDVAKGRVLDAIYLTKPYIMNALSDAIERVLRCQSVEAGGTW